MPVDDTGDSLATLQESAADVKASDLFSSFFDDRFSMVANRLRHSSGTLLGISFGNISLSTLAKSDSSNVISASSSSSDASGLGSLIASNVRLEK